MKNSIAVGVADDHAGEQDDLRHVLEVAQREQVLEVGHELARRGSASSSTIAKPAEDRARDEVGREDRRVPAGRTEVAKSNDTIECTLSTSGVESAASSR
jgi:hypothetical protein